MVTLAILVSQVAGDSATGKADARLSAGLQTATNLYDEAQADSRRAAAKLAAEAGADPAAVAALESGARPRSQALAGRSRRREPGVAAVAIEGANGARGRGGRVRAGRRGLGRSDRRRTARSSARSPRRRRRPRSSSAEVERTHRRARGAGRPAGRDRRPADVARRRRAARLAARRPTSRDATARSCGSPPTEPLGQERLRIALMAPVEAEGFFGSQPKRGDRRDRLLRRRAARGDAAAALAAGLRQGDARRGEADRRRRLLRARSRSAATTRWPAWRASSTG